MKILIVEPMKEPYEKEIQGTLEEMQAIVGGYIQAVYPFEDPVAVVCNEEGKLMGLPYNRLLRDDSGRPYDVLCGTFFVAGLGEEDFASLPADLMKKYKSMYTKEMLLPFPKDKPNKEKHTHER